MTHLIREYRIWRARRRLEKLIRKRQQSFEVLDYKRRRAAMLKHTRAAA